MKKLTGKVHSLHVGIDHGVIRDVESIQMALDGGIIDQAYLFAYRWRWTV